MTPHDYLDVKMALSANFRFRTTSGFRCWEWNRHETIKGHINSQHQYWLADDVVLWNQTDTQAFIKQARRMGLKCQDEGDHIHIQGS